MILVMGRGGGTGRRAGFKIRYWQQCGGSIPFLGTTIKYLLEHQMSKSSITTISLLCIIVLFVGCLSMDAAQRVSNEIMGEIEQAGFQKYDITAETNHNAATLKGYVSTEQDKTKAEQIALNHSEITKVDNQLQVMFTSSYSGNGNNDASQLAENLLSRIKADHRIRDFSIETATIGRRVQVTGKVGNYEDYLRLNQIIKESSPAGSVVNLVQLRERLSDLEINAIIREHLAQINRNDISSSVTKGNLVLRGDARTFEDVDKVLSVVVNTPDLGEIDSQITVNGRPYPVNQFNVGR
jgi:osmotically-inducible protein OsmY